MEQELADAIKEREEEKQQWAERASRADAEMDALRTSLEALEMESVEVVKHEKELASLREAEHVSQEALEKEKLEVARLEREMALMKEAELASHDASESDRAEIVRLESELALMRDSVERASQDAAERGRFQFETLEQELASLKEEHHDAHKKGEILAEVWRHLRFLAGEDVEAADEPADLSLFAHTVQSVETQLMRLKDECSQRQKCCDNLIHTTETLQGEEVCLIVGIQCVNLLRSALK